MTIRRSALATLSTSLLAALVALGAAGCAVTGNEPTDGAEDEDSFGVDQIVGASSVGRRLEVQGHVLVAENATQDAITAAVRRQMRVLFGAARTSEVGLSERTPIINTASFRRDTVTVVDVANPSAPRRRMLRVRYTYRTRAVLPRAMAQEGTIRTATLFGPYDAFAREVIADCHDPHSQDASPASIWYHFDPSLPRCRDGVAREEAAIEADRRRLTAPDREVAAREATRRYLPLTLRLTALEANEEAHPEYHRMYEDGRFVAYSFFGLDDANDPRDYGGKNYFAFLRALTLAQPRLRVTSVSDGVNLLDVRWQNRPIANVTYARIYGWILDDRDYPAEVAYADRNAFRLQVLRQWRDHYVTLGMTADVTVGGARRSVPVEVRTYYGDEEGAAAPRAVQRYIAAFAQADVFQYTGHSHLGSGPLDPANYRSAHFPNRYQIFMINSCVSFNYYNEFFRMHPGGTRNLDTVTNGIEVYLEGSGLSSARFVNAMIDGRFRNYREVLTDMRVDLPWEAAHDASRVADGELDNEFSPARFPMTLTAR